MRSHPVSRIVMLIFFLILRSNAASSQTTSPKEQFGFNIGDDYELVNYTQLLAYWQKLERESERLTLVRIGTTSEGRPMVMAVITSPENQAHLARYKEISRRLVLAEGLTDSQARSLAAEGKAIVQIDGGLHSTEILGSQQLIELVWQMVSGEDDETKRILDNVILLAICSNPDGLELVADWYLREKDPAKRQLRSLPRLYQKYIGHDNNRDFYMITQPETEAIARVMYLDWFPQIVYNHHQSGPVGTVLFCSPFRDPFNYVFDPLVPVGIELVGAAIHNRFVAEGKPGATMRSGASYSTWWNGGLRSTSYYHNMIGILTEMIGSPTPMEIPFLPEKQLPKNDLPYPVAPQKWHFRQSVEYSVTADMAILDLASKYSEDFLFNIYQMGRNSIERGSRDHWTISPQKIALVEEAIAKDGAQLVGTGFYRGYPIKYYDLMYDPTLRDPRGYIISSDQPDFLTATKFVNALIKAGVTVHKSSRSFEVARKAYPTGSYIVKCAQAFRPHILAMFEPQDHPHDFAYPGGPPNAPYDSAGWTLAFQMGISFDRILDAFDGPFEKVTGQAEVLTGSFQGSPNAPGFLLDHRVNDTIIATNRLLKSGMEVFWLKKPLEANGKIYPAGTIYILNQPATFPRLKEMVEDLGLRAEAIDCPPQQEALRLNPVRIGLWDIYGGSMASGWARWLLEKFEFPFEVIFPPELDMGDLASKFDVLIFATKAIPREDQEPEDEFHRYSPPKPEEVPEEYRDRIGRVTVAKTIPHLLRFLEEGKSIITIGSSTALGFHAGLSISDALVEKQADGADKPLPREKYFVPGSILEVRVDNSHPVAYGMQERADVYFSNSPVFKLHPDAPSKGIQAVAWFDSGTPLRSGWAWGQHYLDKGVAIVEAEVGKGNLFLLCPEVIFRGQPHGTFKFFFNSILYAGTTSQALR